MKVYVISTTLIFKLTLLHVKVRYGINQTCSNAADWISVSYCEISYTLKLLRSNDRCWMLLLKEILSSRNKISSRYRALRSNVPSIQGQNFRHPTKFLRAMNLVKIFFRGIPAQIYSSLRQWTRGPIDWGIWCSNCGSLNPLEITTACNLLFLHAAIFH